MSSTWNDYPKEEPGGRLAIGEYALSVNDVAEMLGVHPRTVRNWVKIGSIPFVKVGVQYRFSVARVREWVESGKAAS